MIFDMDGVIVDTEPMQINRHKIFLESLRTKIPEKELLKIVGTNKKMAFKKIISLYNNKFNDYKDYYDSLSQYYEKEPIDFTKLINDDVKKLLDWLKESNFKLALASSGSKEKINVVLTQNKLNDYFEVVESGDSFKESKPNPEIYFNVSEKLSVKPEKCMVIEDSNYGIEAAKRAGMYTVALKEDRFSFSQENADITVKRLINIKDVLIKKINR